MIYFTLFAIISRVKLIVKIEENSNKINVIVKQKLTAWVQKIRRY